MNSNGFYQLQVRVQKNYIFEFKFGIAALV